MTEPNEKECHRHTHGAVKHLHRFEDGRVRIFCLADQKVIERWPVDAQEAIYQGTARLATDQELSDYSVEKHKHR